MADKAPKTERTSGEGFIAAGGKLVEKLRELIAAGNARRLILRKPNGNAVIEIPLTAGVIASGVMIALAPVLAAVAGLAAGFRLEVLRGGTNNADDPE